MDVGAEIERNPEDNKTISYGGSKSRILEI